MQKFTSFKTNKITLAFFFNNHNKPIYFKKSKSTLIKRQVSSTIKEISGKKNQYKTKEQPL